MRSARRASLRLLRLAMAGCVLLPVLLFVSGGVTIRGATERATDERLVRTADVLHEQALKVFQSTDVLLETLLDMTRGLSDPAIRADFSHWHARLAAMSGRLAYLQSIWIIDAAGHVCATDTTDALPDIDTGGRDYFRAQAGGDAGLFVGGMLTSLLGTAPPFFNLSRRREETGGSFGGVVTASLAPGDFVSFYRAIGSTPGSFLALMRRDGTLLARFPPLPEGSRPASHPPILSAVAGPADRGLLTAVSPVDGRERRLAWRRLDPYPVFVMAGQETAAIRHEWLATLATHLVFGLPATVLILGALWIAMSRTRALFDEAARCNAAEAALQRAQRLEALGELTGGVAHDVNNLLMIVLGNVERLRRRPRDAGDIRALDTIDAAVHRGEALTRQLLAFARRRVLYPEPIDLARQLAGMGGLLAHSLRGDIAVTIEAEAPPGTYVVKVDPGEFRLAVLNIAVNARDAMPQGGWLTLRLRRLTLGAGRTLDDLRGECVAVSLSDTGGGIAPALLPRVFDPFFTTKPVGTGTGLGLSQVYGFACQSGGSVGIESTQGAGTTVTLYLPHSDEAPVQTEPDVAPAPAPGSGLRALLMLGSADAAVATRMHLELLGFDVTMADSERAARSLVEMHSYALLVADILSPRGLNGMELALTLRARPQPVAAILVSTNGATAEQARREGFIVLPRPCDEHQLRAAVVAALSGVRERAAGA